MTAGRLEGKVAIITGGGRGIGLGIVRVLSREGARVAVTDIDFGNAARAATEIEETGKRALAFELDVTRPEQAEVIVRQVAESFGTVDIL
ncbi:MAG: SDR family NAD(P)-dependent oxidoreductase, partial [Tepidiformaceae bacterium]